MHPFSDRSGIVFFDVKSTVITSVNLSMLRFNECLDHSGLPMSDDEHLIIERLCGLDVLVEVAKDKPSPETICKTPDL